MHSWPSRLGCTSPPAMAGATAVLCDKIQETGRDRPDSLNQQPAVGVPRIKGPSSGPLPHSAFRPSGVLCDSPATHRCAEASTQDVLAHDARPVLEALGRRSVGLAGLGGQSVETVKPVISAMRAAMRADLAAPLITWETMDLETSSSSATAAGVVPAMRMAALICSGCMVVRSNSTC